MAGHLGRGMDSCEARASTFAAATRPVRFDVLITVLMALLVWTYGASWPACICTVVGCLAIWKYPHRSDKDDNGVFAADSELCELGGLLSEPYGRSVSVGSVKQVRENNDQIGDGKIRFQELESGDGRIQSQELVNVWPQYEQLSKDAEDRSELGGVITLGPSTAAEETVGPSEERRKTDDDFEMSILEQEVLAELNLARTQPSTYLRLIEEELSCVNASGLLKRPGRNPLRLNEGMAAYEDAMRALRLQDPVGELESARGLCLAARDHCRDQGSTGATGHEGSDGSALMARMERYGSWLGRCGENISYGPNRGREIVMQLIVDDGVPDRCHRNNVYKTGWKVVGIATGGHPGGFMSGIMCVQDFAEGYIDKPPPGAAKKNVGKVVVYGGDDGHSENWCAALESQGIEFEVQDADLIPDDLLFGSGFPGGDFAIPVVQVNETMHWADAEHSWDSSTIMRLAKQIAEQ